MWYGERVEEKEYQRWIRSLLIPPRHLADRYRPPAATGFADFLNEVTAFQGGGTDG